MLRLAIAFVFLLFISCRKEKNFSIEGTWQVIATKSSGPWDCACYKDLPEKDRGYYEFKNNGTYTLAYSPTFAYSGCTANYRLKGNNTIIWQKCGLSTGEYEDALRVKDGGIIEIETIGIGGPSGLRLRRVLIFIVD